MEGPFPKGAALLIFDGTTQQAPQAAGNVGKSPAPRFGLMDGCDFGADSRLRADILGIERGLLGLCGLRIVSHREQPAADKRQRDREDGGVDVWEQCRSLWVAEHRLPDAGTDDR